MYGNTSEGSNAIKRGSKGYDNQTARVTIPAAAAGQSIHIILEIHDDGSPDLYAYRRVVLNAKRSAQSRIR